MRLATWLRGQERLLHVHQESTIPAIFEIINRFPSSEFQKNRKGFAGCGSNQFFVSKILVAPLCAIATTEASGDSRGITIFR
jgi:hypothetical protein